MKKVIVTLSVILLTAVSAMAGGGKDATRYYIPNFSQGWFIDIAGTYSIFAGNNCTYHDISTYYGGWPGRGDKPFIGFSAAFGRRVSPSIALRTGYDWHPSANRLGDFNFQNLHFDVMGSPIDLIAGYNPHRFYTMWIYGGASVLGYSKGNEPHYLIGWRSNLEYGVEGGIMNNFRLSNSLDFHIDVTAVSTRWSYDDVEFDGFTLWHRSHFDFAAKAGLMWYLGGRRYDVVPECEVADCSKQEQTINDLNARIAQLQNELDKCGGIVEVQPCDTVFVNTEGEVITYPFSIFFNKGSYELRDGRDRVNMEEMAKVAKKEGYKLVLRGTCDSATASSAFNKTLAENRCNKVKAELVKLGIPESDITIDAVGGVKELNPTEYDRRVLIQLTK